MKPKIGQIWKRGQYYFFLVSRIPGYSDGDSDYWNVIRLGSSHEYEVCIRPTIHKFIQ